jgi:uncharacterized protein with ParB-like and HNH nuclease domain
MFKPDSASILSIFTAPQKVVVPKYQRNFAWGKTEAQELMEDVKAKTEDQNFNLFLGTVIFDISKSISGEMYVIDGQQRITTTSILLIACRQVAKKKNSQLADAIQEKISFKDPYSGKYEGQRLIVSPSVKEVYDYISQDSWAGEFPDKIGNKQVKRQVNKIKPLFDYFLSEIRDLSSNDLEIFVRSLYDAYFIRIDIENTSQAFDIFERMNARGLPLDVADLLKNHIFANINSDEIEERWREIIENSGSTPLRMLKYFWVSKNGYVRKSDLYRGLKDYSTKNGPDSLVNELEDFSYFYWIVREGEISDMKEYLDDKGLNDITSNSSYLDRFFSAIEGLRLFRVTQVYPVLYSALSAYQNVKERSAKDLLNLLEIFEKYHFINNVICERVGNEVEKLYTDYARDFNKEKFGPLVANLRKSLLQRLATKEEFISNFSELSYASDSISLICYVFDRINNNLVNARGGQRVALFFPDESVQRKNFNVEHFLSQKQKKNETLDKDTLEAIDNIGNLLVISRHTNSDLGSLDPAGKMDSLKKNPSYTNNLPYLVDFISKYEKSTKKWDKDLINKRAQELAELAYDKIWSFK